MQGGGRRRRWKTARPNRQAGAPSRIRVRCARFALTMINDALVVLSACGGGDGRDESLCDGGGRAHQRHAAAARDDQTAEHRVCECE